MHLSRTGRCSSSLALVMLSSTLAREDILGENWGWLEGVSRVGWERISAAAALPISCAPSLALIHLLSWTHLGLHQPKSWHRSKKVHWGPWCLLCSSIARSRGCARTAAFFVSAQGRIQLVVQLEVRYCHLLHFCWLIPPWLDTMKCWHLLHVICQKMSNTYRYCSISDVAKFFCPLLHASPHILSNDRCYCKTFGKLIEKSK